MQAGGAHMKDEGGAYMKDEGGTYMKDADLQDKEAHAITTLRDPIMS